MAGEYTPEEYQRALDDYNRALISGMDQNSAAFKQLKENLDDAIKGTKNYTYQMRQASQQLGSSMLALGKQISSGAQGTAVFNDALGSGADLLGKFLKEIPGIGKYLRLAVIAGAEYVKAVNKQSDALYKSYQEISRTGAIGAGGMTEVYQNLKQFGYGIDELGNMGALLADNGKNLALFSGSVSRGTGQIADLAQSVKDSDLRRQFMNLGLSVDAQNQMIAGYAVQQGRLGRATDVTTKGMAAYVREQEILTRLTGQSAREMQEQFEAQLQMDDFMAGIMDMPAEAQEQAKIVINQLSAIDPSGKLARGFAASINGLGHTTEEGAQMFAASNGKSQEAAMALAKGTLSASDYLQQYGDAVSQNIPTMKGLSKVGANYMGNLATNVRLTQLSGKGFAKVFDETGKAVDNAAAGFDDSTNAASELRIAQMNSRDSMENFLQHGVKPVTMGMELLAKAIDKLLGFLPGSSSIADAKKEQQRLETERAKAAQDLAARQKQMAEEAKKRAELEQAKKEGKPAEQIQQKEQELKQTQEKINASGGDLALATAALAGQQTNIINENEKKLEQLKKQNAQAEAETRRQLIAAKAEEDRIKIEKEAAEAAAARLAAEKKAKEDIEKAQAERKRLEEQEIRDARAAAQQKLEEKNQRASTQRANKAASLKAPDLVKDTDLLDRLNKGGITDTKAQANILAQIKAESGGVPKSESLKYSGKRLFELFGAGNTAGNKVRFKSVEEASALAAKGEEAVGNLIYGGRMGNKEDEGYRYRGRGMIQITGKENYEKYGKIIGQDLVSNPDLANDPEIAKQIAVAYFQEKQKNKVNLSDISAIGRAVGYAGGKAETDKRAQLAQMYESQIPKAADGDVLSGPKSGYRAVLHGTEAVVPLPDGRTIPVTIAGLTEQNDRLAQVLSAIETRMGSTGSAGSPVSDTLLSKLDDFIRVSSDQLGVLGKILKAQA
jgi:predicted chitinase